MIKVEAIKDFNFSSMDKITNLKRKMLQKENYIYKDDIFECDKKMYNYLNGGNQLGEIVIKIIEYKPEK